RRGSESHAERLLKKTRLEDVAVVMRFLDLRFQRQVFDLLPDNTQRAELLTELDAHLLSDLLEGREVKSLVRVLELMSVDAQADLINELPQTLAQELLNALKPAEVEELEDILQHDPETAGGIMCTDYFALPEDTTAGEAIQALQGSDDVEMAFYVYVINEHGHLVGVVSLRALVITPPSTPLRDIMASDILSAKVETDQEQVAQMAARYNLLAIPVVDQSNRLVGIVTIDDVIDVLREEATEDILRMAGVDESAYESKSLRKNLRKRAPWLFATWLGGLAGSLLIGSFEGQLEKQVALAAFIPIVLGMGGNVGTQTATIMVRGLATGHISADVGWRYLGREFLIGVSLGVLYGTLLGVYAFTRYSGEAHPLQLAFTVGLSILSSMSVAALVGALTPLIFDRLHIDPAVATGPLVTTTVDILGILTYFLMAGLFLSGLGG
ncbi:magnesium transporter, partial [Myxococcota bacterium]|nr:magnesium transporter [Myxococcota bacterium]